MINRHTTFLVDEINALSLCGRNIGYEVAGSTYELPFEVNQTTGEHDFNSCENCQASLKKMNNDLLTLFEGTESKKGFPLCCDYHKNLIELKEFKREDFLNVPSMVARKVIYTNQHILNNIKTEDWEVKIFDYIEWVVKSFGSVPKGCGESLFMSAYFDYVKQLLTKNKNLPKDRVNIILKFLLSFQIEGDEAKSNFKELLKTYENWLNIFPFSVSYFKDLKAVYEKRIPVINGETKTNIYSGETKVKMHSNKSLVEALFNLTKQLLHEVKTANLLESGVIVDASAHRITLLTENHRIKQDGLLGVYTKGEIKYINLLSEWMKNERYFFKGMAYEIKNSDTKNKKPKVETLSPTTFEELFHNSTNAEPCLNILREVDPPVIDASNAFIGKNKGIIPLWVKVLKNHSPKPILKHCKDIIYKDLLNAKIIGLNLTNDASEFRKNYKRLESNNTELEIKAILSQYSQNGKLGK